jgi:hypothetical protein
LPVVRLRFELQAARRARRSFNESRPTAMSAALSTVSDGREVRRWTTALYQTREAWRLAWDREGARCFSVLAAARIDVTGSW